MKKSHKQSKTNNNNIKERAGLEARSEHTKSGFRITFARHFRANSYVPLLLALRPRARSTGKSVQDMANFVQHTGQNWHFRQFCPLRWTKCKFLPLFKGRKPSLVGRSSVPLVSSLSVLALSLIFISSLLGLVAFPSSASAASITLTIPSSALVVKATPDQFSKSEAQRISVSTDSVGGYTLKLSSKNNDENSNYLVNGTGSKIAPISKPLTDTEFSTSEDWNVWGFKPSKLNGSNNSSSESGKFIAAPTQGQDIILDTTNTSTNDIEGQANNYDITLGVKVDSTLPAGSYSNTFVLTATVNALKYDITYDAGNANDEVTNMPSPIKDTGETSSTTIPLTTTIPEWFGYVFQGWCTVKPEMKSGRDDCAGTTDASSGKQGVMYKSGADFPLTMASTTTTLYAMWNELLLTDVIDATGSEITFKVGDGIEMIMVADSQSRTFTPEANGMQANATTKWWPYYAISGTDVTMNADPGNKYLITVVPEKGNKFTKWQKNNDGTEWTAIGTAGKYKTMQDLTQDECTAAGAGGMNVTDTRNDVSYTVGQFAGRCWMHSNLRLEGGTKLDSTDSDLRSGEAFEVPVSVTADTWRNYVFGKKEMIECNGGVGENVKPFEMISDTVKDQNRFCADNPSTVTEFYFNWYAAIANDSDADGTSSGLEETVQELDKKAKGSICPKNWRLMEENAAGDGILITATTEIEALIAEQNTNSSNNPGRLITSGTFFGEKAQQHDVGHYGYWWSASRMDRDRSYDPVFTFSNEFNLHLNRFGGRSVRCILRDDQ